MQSFMGWKEIIKMDSCSEDVNGSVGSFLFSYFNVYYYYFK